MWYSDCYFTKKLQARTLLPFIIQNIAGHSLVFIVGCSTCENLKKVRGGGFNRFLGRLDLVLTNEREDKGIVLNRLGSGRL